MQTNFKSNKPQGARSLHRRAGGFTLVELLIVIAILGILAGLLAFGVSAARTAILKRAQKFEIEMIAQAVERYREKYGDYPPDGSSWPIMEAHLRKAFPNILNSELNMLNPANAAANGYIRNDNYVGSHPFGGRVMDPAESLVFFLGGFSSDPQRPLSGPGGPFKLNGTVYIYNTQRENGFFEFKTNRLTLQESGVSNDEEIYGEGVGNDLLPVFVGAGPSIAQGGVPTVYFDNRSYQLYNLSINMSFFNFYTPGPTSSANCARPFLSNETDTSYAGPTPSAGFKAKPQRYANSKTFQLMNAGYDNLYGCQPPSAAVAGGVVLFSCPSGVPCSLDPFSPSPTPPLNRFFESTSPLQAKYFFSAFGNLRPVDDNTANFIDGPTFAESP
jgi:prepilin-type N-terminal cleavage/methylation domain-containing protein